MPATVQDIVINSPGSFVMVATAVDQDEQPLDLTGYSGQMQIRADPADTEVLASATVSIDTVTAEVTATFTPTDTAAMDFAAAYYDLRVISGTGSIIEYLAKGKVAVEQMVTR